MPQSASKDLILRGLLLFLPKGNAAHEEGDHLENPDFPESPWKKENALNQPRPTSAYHPPGKSI